MTPPYLAERDLGARPYEAEITCAARAPHPAVDTADGNVHLATPHSRGGVSWRSPTSDCIDLSLSSRVPRATTLYVAGVSGAADLTAFDVTGFTVKGVAARLDLRLLAAAHCAVSVDLKGVGFDLTVRITAGTQVSVAMNGLGASLDVDGTSVGATTWTSPGFDTTAPHHELTASGVGSHIRLESAK